MTRCNRGCVVRRGGLGVIAAVTAVLVLAGPVGASIAHSRLVSPTPAAFTPKVVLGTSGETVFAFAQVGTTMYVGGRFAQIRDASGTTTYYRANFAAFNATTGAILPLSLPTNGAVQVIVPSPDGRAIYIGGDYTSIGGVAARGIVRFDLTTNAHRPEPSSPASTASVTDAAFVGLEADHRRHVHAAPAVDRPGHRRRHRLHQPRSSPGKTDPNDAIRVRRFAANPAGTTLVALGNFTAVAGQAREQAFRVDLTTSPRATLSPWYAPRFDAGAGQHPQLQPRGRLLARRLVLRGRHQRRRPTGPTGSATRRLGSRPRTSARTAEPTWINWTGGDSLYSVAVTGVAVYVGGHQRWLDNPEGQNSAGPGAVSRPGIGAIDPATGTALAWNPTKDRGHGTEKLYATAAGLWVGSDGTSFAGLDRPGIVFCPLT